MGFINKMPPAQLQSQIVLIQNSPAASGGLPGHGNSIMIGDGGAKKKSARHDQPCSRMWVPERGRDR
jgi:hypothetical protein